MRRTSNLRRFFEIRTRAGHATLSKEIIECEDEDAAIDRAKSRLAEAVPGVAVELWRSKVMLWSSRAGALLDQSV